MAFEKVFVQYPTGQRYGPATIPEVVTWAATGMLPNECFIIDVETQQMRMMGTFPEIVAAIPHSLSDSLIPRNGWALASYYTGIFSFVGLFLVCVPGMIAGLAAIGMGIAGLRRAKENPLLRGQAHCWTGIICGAICFLIPIVFWIVVALQ